MSMKIVSLTSENIKRLTAVHIEPSGNLVQITGRNGAGKTSVLDSIWWALAGAGNVQAAPIRKGENRARIEVKLSDGEKVLIVERTFTLKDDGEVTTSIAVKNPDGARFPSPQRMLDALLGELTFDPLAFSRMAPKDQFDALRKFVPGIDFEAIDNADRGDRERRKDINHRLHDAQGSVNAMRVPEEAPVQPVDESALVQRMQEASTHNADIERRKSNRAQRQQDIAAKLRDAELKLSEAEQLMQRVAALRQEAQAIADSAEQQSAELAVAPALPDPIDVAAVATELNAARERNQRYAEWAADKRRKGELIAVADALETESEEITARMAERQAEKNAAIAKAHMPIDGLSFGEGAVLLHGVPFDQASDAERLRTSVAIAMAMNPKLRVVRIRDGSLLDQDGIELIRSMADSRDCQVWMEQVDTSGSIGIVIEDGHVRQVEDGLAQESAA